MAIHASLFVINCGCSRLICRSSIFLGRTQWLDRVQLLHEKARRNHEWRKLQLGVELAVNAWCKVEHLRLSCGIHLTGFDTSLAFTSWRQTSHWRWWLAGLTRGSLIPKVAHRRNGHVSWLLILLIIWDHWDCLCAISIWLGINGHRFNVLLTASPLCLLQTDFPAVHNTTATTAGSFQKNSTWGRRKKRSWLAYYKRRSRTISRNCLLSGQVCRIVCQIGNMIAFRTRGGCRKVREWNVLKGGVSEEYLCWRKFSAAFFWMIEERVDAFNHFSQRLCPRSWRWQQEAKQWFRKCFSTHNLHNTSKGLVTRDNLNRFLISLPLNRLQSGLW